MFCFQCEQTAGCTGCTKNAGVCGKTAITADLQDRLTASLIDLAHAANGQKAKPHTVDLTIRALFTTVTNVNFYNDVLEQMIAEVKAEKGVYANG